MKLKSPFLARKARLELASLMDVMLLVLVFFVYSVMSMAVHRGVKVDLPSDAGALEKGERAVVTIDSSDRLQLNGRPLDRVSLVREVGRLVAVKRDLPVIVSGDRRASLGEAVPLIAELKRSGVEKISFQVSGKERE